MEAIAVYVAFGIAVAFAFLSFGIRHVLTTGETITAPARCVLFPGTVILWPLVVARWLRARP